MITSKLKTALTTAGCNQVLYESDKLAGIITDQSLQDSIVGLIIQPNTVKLEVKGNGVHEHYPPITIEIMKQVKPEDTAENNEATLVSLLEVCKAFINALITVGDFKKIQSIEAVKIPENKYDANMIGWILPIDLFLLENKNNC